MLDLLRTFSWQELRQHPWRYAAALMSIALGVALAFSVHVINASALREFSSALQSVQGQPDVSVVSSGAFDEQVYEQIAAQKAVQLASPVLEISTYAFDAQGKKHSVKVLGMDALIAPELAPGLMMRPQTRAQPSAPANAPPAEASSSNTRFTLFAPGQVFLNAAARSALGTGTITVAAQQSLVQLHAAGAVAAGGSSLLVMDLGAMQDAFGLSGQLSRIDVRLQAGFEGEALVLPSGLKLQRPQEASQRSDQLSRAYRVNMTVLALVALFTGAFLVYSVLTLAVAKRAQQFALLGVLGLTARQRLQLVLLEAGLLGAVGSGIGIALGTALAAAGLAALGGDLGGGYFSGNTPPLQWSGWAAAVYAGLGWAAALAGAWWPARSAQALPLALSLKGLGALSATRRQPWFALFLVALGAIFSGAPAVFGIPIAAYMAVALLLVGGMGLLPWAVSLLYDQLAPCVAAHALPMLAVERARRMREVAVVAVSGVVAALSLGVALTVMVSSFRTSVSTWLDTMLPAPLYVRLTNSTQTGQRIFFPSTALAQVAQIPGVASVSGLRQLYFSQRADSPDVALIAKDISLLDAANSLPLVGNVYPPPTPDAIALYVSEAMVDLHGARLGEIYPLKLPLAPVKPHSLATNNIAPTFYIAGVWRDYVRQFGSVVMARADYQRISGDERINDMAISFTAQADTQQVQALVKQTLSQDELFARLLEFASSSEIRSITLKMFDRSFAVTYWLQAVAIAIGLFGVASSFSAQVLSRRKEFGLLAHLGLTRGQILRVVALEGAAWTLIGAAAGCALGLLVALVLIHVVNPQSFHWTMDMSIPWARLALLACAVVLAGTLTAWLAGRAAASRDAVMAVKEDW